VKLSHDPAPQMPFNPGGLDLDSFPSNEDGTKLSHLPTFHPSDLVGCTFLLDPQEDGQRFCTRIVEALEDHDAKLHCKPECFKFCCSIKDDQYEEVLSYNEILNYIEQQDDNSTKIWKFHHIMAHEGLLWPTDLSYKGSKYNVMIEWENGEITSEPLILSLPTTLSPARFMPRKMACSISMDGNALRGLPDMTRSYSHG